MTASSASLRTLAAELRSHNLDIWARDLEVIAVLVSRMERTLDEIMADAQEDADIAERAGSNVVRLRLAGTNWIRKEFE